MKSIFNKEKLINIIKNKKFVIAFSVFILTIFSLQYSYAAFFSVKMNTNNQEITTGTLLVSFGKEGSSITGEAMMPMGDKEGIDNAESRVVYVQNTGSLSSTYTLTVGYDMEEYTKLNNPNSLTPLEYVKVAVYEHNGLNNDTLIVGPVTVADLPVYTQSATDNRYNRYSILFDSVEGEVNDNGGSTKTYLIKMWLSEKASPAASHTYFYVNCGVTAEVENAKMAYNIQGVLKDYNDDVVEGATISLQNNSYVTTTNEDGIYTLFGIYPGTYNLDIKYNGITYSGNLTIEEGSTVAFVDLGPTFNGTDVYTIARNYGTTLSKIKKANNISDNIEGYTFDAEEDYNLMPTYKITGALDFNISGLNITLDSGSSYTMEYIETDYAIPQYSLLSDENPVYDGENDLVITIAADRNKLTSVFLEEDKLTEGTDYEVASGSTIVTIYSSYLDTLEDGNYTITFNFIDGVATTSISIGNVCSYESGEVVAYSGTPGETKYITSCNGFYKLEVWGAQGGGGSGFIGGYGGYSIGIVDLSSDETLYINVGGQGTFTSGNGQHNSIYADGGYNGGGQGYSYTQWSGSLGSGGTSGGGGTTHIATVTKSDETGKTGELKYLESYKNTGNSSSANYYVSNEILIVAGGGGGASVHYPGEYSNSYSQNGAHGGGYEGFIGSKAANAGYNVSPGKQVEYISNTIYTCNSPSGSNEAGSFGLGGRGWPCEAGGPGGGGGWYGGTGGYDCGAAAGGSGYIASSRLISYDTITKHMAAYGATGDYLSDDTETKTIAATGALEEPTADYAKIGNGYAKITYCGDSADSCE